MLSNLLLTLDNHQHHPYLHLFFPVEYFSNSIHLIFSSRLLLPLIRLFIGNTLNSLNLCSRYFLFPHPTCYSLSLSFFSFSVFLFIQHPDYVSEHFFLSFAFPPWWWWCMCVCISYFWFNGYLIITVNVTIFYLDYFLSSFLIFHHLIYIFFFAFPVQLLLLI